MGLFVAHAYPQPGTVRGDRQVLISQPSDQVEGLLHGLLLGFAKRVGFDVFLDRRPHLGCRSEISVGRHEPAQRLVRPLEVVALHEEAKPPLTIGEVCKHRAAEKLVPQRLPEALDLSEGFGVLRPALDVPDPMLPQPFLEERLAAPGRVLSPLVGQDLLRHPEGRDPALKRLEDQRALLVVCQDEAHEEARVVVHEGRQVQALMPSQQECEDVRLPELIGRCPLEAPRWPLPTLDRARRRRGRHPRFGQHPPHGGL